VLRPRIHLMRRVFVVLLLLGCNARVHLGDHLVLADGAPPILDGGSPDAEGPVPCGAVTCPAGSFCCNPECGACATIASTCAAIRCAVCMADYDCSSDEYCALTACGGPGTCEARPARCEFDPAGPVCGCNGITYADACSAASLGISVARSGLCNMPRVCMTSEECIAGREYCYFPSGCGITGSPGECRALPSPMFTCPPTEPPVCGCDGTMYPCADAAAASGISEDAFRACVPPVGSPCGGLVGMACAPDQWCDFPADSCGIADELGTCRPRPTSCTMDYAPTCACDRVSYFNECLAQQAGMDRNSGC
jgi:hypothetical protein